MIVSQTNQYAAQGEKKVGRFAVEMEVANYEDVVQSRKGNLAAEKVRRMTIRGVVDPGASGLVLPGKIVKALGFPEKGQVKCAMPTVGGRCARKSSSFT